MTDTAVDGTLAVIEASKHSGALKAATKGLHDVKGTIKHGVLMRAMEAAERLSGQTEAAIARCWCGCNSFMCDSTSARLLAAHWLAVLRARVGALALADVRPLVAL